MKTSASTTGAAQNSAAAKKEMTDEPVFPSYLSVALNKPSKKIVSRVKSLADTLCAKLDDLKPAYKEEKQVVNPPFLIDQSRNTFTVLTKNEDDLLEDDPYNQMVALVIGKDHQFDHGGGFSLPDDPFLSAPAKVEAQLFVNYASHVRCGHLTLNENATSQKEILHATNQYVACVAWEVLVKKPNILRPPKPLVTRSRARGAKREDYTWARVLRSIVNKWFTKEYSMYGNAIVHALNLIVINSVSANRELWMNVLSSKRSFKPTRDELKENGIIPDVNIRDYLNLFTPLEVEEIKKTGLLQQEDELRSASSRLKTVEDIISFIGNCDANKKKLKDDRMLSIIKQIRRDRLVVCSDLKKEHRVSGALNMWDSVSREYQRPKIRAAFAPGALHIANGTLEGYTSATLSSMIKWNQAEKSYVLEADPTHESALAIRIATELMQLMSA
jgi:hypothetical protein